jgi:hypothetical protein
MLDTSSRICRRLRSVVSGLDERDCELRRFSPDLSVERVDVLTSIARYAMERGG